MLVSKKTLTFMQIFPRPLFLTKPSSRLRAQSPQPRPGALCPILVRGEICQIIADQSVDGGVMFGGMTANGGEYSLIDAESDILHSHSICVTVRYEQVEQTSTRSELPIRRRLATCPTTSLGPGAEARRQSVRSLRLR